MQNGLIIRKEYPADKDQIYFLINQAFESSTAAELVERLREQDKFIISLVAEIGKKIVGHIAFTRVFLSNSHNPAPGAGLAPLAVLKEYRNRRIGAALIHEGLQQCEDLGIEFVVVLGYPKYYARFGFQKASRYGIRCAYNIPDVAFMILELNSGILDSISDHIIQYDHEFDTV